MKENLIILLGNYREGKAKKRTMNNNNNYNRNFNIMEKSQPLFRTFITDLGFFNFDFIYQERN